MHGITANPRSEMYPAVALPAMVMMRGMSFYLVVAKVFGLFVNVPSFQSLNFIMGQIHICHPDLSKTLFPCSGHGKGHCLDCDFAESCSRSDLCLSLGK